jgi:hypothetical protein
MIGQLGIEYLPLNFLVRSFLRPVANIRNDDFPSWGRGKGMPEALPSIDFQGLSGRQFELYELFFLIVVGDLQIQDLFQEQHRARKATGANTGGRLVRESQGHLLYSELT